MPINTNVEFKRSVQQPHIIGGIGTPEWIGGLSLAIQIISSCRTIHGFLWQTRHEHVSVYEISKLTYVRQFLYINWNAIY